VDALPLILQELKERGFRIVHVVPASAARPATVTTAEAWLPHSRPKPAAPLIQVAALQELDAKILTKRSAAELCSLTPPQELAGRRSHRHARTIRIAHAEPAPAKVARSKAKPAKVAHAGLTAARPDVHSVQ
jgi:hypothetical protein